VWKEVGCGYGYMHADGRRARYGGLVFDSWY
jgi:hypothetical protein